MRLTAEQKDRIAQDFIAIFQSRYGDEWKTKLTQNLKPSPLQQIAKQHGVSVSHVRKIRREFIAVGNILEFMTTLTAPYPTSSTGYQL